jgi:hypothetical protein
VARPWPWCTVSLLFTRFGSWATDVWDAHWQR